MVPFFLSNGTIDAAHPEKVIGSITPCFTKRPSSFSIFPSREYRTILALGWAEESNCDQICENRT